MTEILQQEQANVGRGGQQTLHQLASANLTPSLRTVLQFTLSDQVGALDSALQVFRQLGINLSGIQSRPSRSGARYYDFIVDFIAPSTDVVEKLEERLKLQTAAKDVLLLGSGIGAGTTKNKSPWFPTKLRDLDGFAEKVLEMGEHLSSDHPGANDVEYRARRSAITKIARMYKTGQEIPRIEYLPHELATWKECYGRLRKLYPTHACKEHNYVFPLLEQNCGYSEDSIPQLEDISRYLKQCTGFTLRPVMGLLTARDFLNGLAFRVFHSTQYIRHHSKPLYTPEPDICHELLGHVPLFADPDFADFSQEIGLATLGASDEDLDRLASIYWYTVEFGLCRQKGEDGKEELRAYGAGLLSSFGELEYSITSDVPERLDFDPFVTAEKKYPVTIYQPTYYVADSFRDATDKVRAYVARLNRPFTVRYNPYTETVEVLDNKDAVAKHARSLRAEIGRLVEALEKMGGD